MRVRWTARLCIALLLAGGLAAAAAEPAFTGKPSVTKAGEAFKIGFAVSAPTDCEVAVLDAAGNVVRHLAAGVLGGEKAPPAPLKAGLTQEFVWDGKDDFGQPPPSTSHPAPFKVRVRLGTAARLGKVLLDERGIGWSPRSATVGPDGLVYVLQEHAQTKSTWLIEAYTREGKYVRTVAPYPASLPPERLAGLPRVKLSDGRLIPQIQHFGMRSIYPDSIGLRPQRMLITSKGWIVLVNSASTHNAGGRLVQRLLVLDTAGGTPRASYLGPVTSSEGMAYGLCFTALSPDEQWVYTSGQLKRGGSNDDLSTAPLHAIFRVGWDDKDPPKPFIGELGKAGADETHLNAPRGVDTDADGRIYVCDHGNNRVAVFDKDGKWAGKLDVECPDQVVVNKKTGAVYVLNWKPPAGSANNPAAASWFPVSNTKYKPADMKVESRVFRFARFDPAAAPAAPTASVEVGRPYCTMTLDASGQEPTLWLSRNIAERAYGTRRGVEKVVDLGAKLAEPVEVIKLRTLPDVYQVAASPVSDDVFVHSYSEGRIIRVDGLTGEAKVLPVGGGDVAAGPQGQLVVYNYVHYFKSLAKLDQYDREGKPSPFAAGGAAVIPDIAANHWGHENTGSRGFSVSPRGEPVIVGRRENEDYSVRALAADGKERILVRGLRGEDGAPVVDLAGNVYVASAARPADGLVPAELRDTPAAAGYAAMYGSVIKFRPAGGALCYPPADPKKVDAANPWPPADAGELLKLSAGNKTDVYARDALWAAPGFSIVPNGPFCHCYTSRFAVDGYGRVFMPDAGLFAVRVVDGAGNPLLIFGEYGNADDSGAAGRIPLGWPYAVSLGRSGVYVSDFVNRRVLRVDLTCAAEAVAEIR
ncbi:MAG TPA: hypothetical protein PK280_06815 [Planctomycetota bacterium]|nr:hypothetical protein [Planctomycetota bacterium]